MQPGVYSPGSFCGNLLGHARGCGWWLVVRGRVSMQSDQSGWETTGFITMGGAAGQYSIESPWQTPAQIIVLAANADGAGQITVAEDDWLTPTQLNTDWRGFIVNFAAAGAGAVAWPDWSETDGRLYMTVTGASHCWLTFQWRRLAPQLRGLTAARDAERATRALAAAAAANPDTLGNAHNQWEIHGAYGDRRAAMEAARGGSAWGTDWWRGSVGLMPAGPAADPPMRAMRGFPWPWKSSSQSSQAQKLAGDQSRRRIPKSQRGYRG